MNDLEEIDLYFCFPGRNYYSEAMVAWANTVQYLMSNKISYRFNFAYTPMLQHTRNLLIGINPETYDGTIPTKPFGGKYKPKKVIMIDDDIVWTVEDIKKIIESDKDIIAGFYWSEIENKVVAEFIDNPGNKIEAHELNNINDLVICKDNSLDKVNIKKLIIEKEKERSNQDNQYKPIQTKVINNNPIVQTNKINSTQNYIETYEELKRGSQNKSNQQSDNKVKNYDNILEGLKDLGIIKM